MPHKQKKVVVRAPTGSLWVVGGESIKTPLDKVAMSRISADKVRKAAKAAPRPVGFDEPLRTEMLERVLG